MGKIYFRVVLIIIVSLGIFGVAGPYLISSDNSGSVLGGIALIALGIPLIYKLVKSTFKDSAALVNQLSDKEEKQ